MTEFNGNVLWIRQILEAARNKLELMLDITIQNNKIIKVIHSDFHHTKWNTRTLYLHSHMSAEPRKSENIYQGHYEPRN